MGTKDFFDLLYAFLRQIAESLVGNVTNTKVRPTNVFYFSILLTYPIKSYVATMASKILGRRLIRRGFFTIMNHLQPH